MHDIKLNYAELAKEFGPDCTAKAIMHQIPKIKAKGNGATTTTTTTPRKPRSTPSATPKKSKTLGKNRKKNSDGDDEDDEDDGDDLTGSLSASKDRAGVRRRTPKHNYAEVDGDEDEDEDGDDDGEQEKKVGDGLDELNAADVSYSIRRLVRGLGSPRESSRLGFAVALTEVRACPRRTHDTHARLTHEPPAAPVPH